MHFLPFCTMESTFVTSYLRSCPYEKACPFWGVNSFKVDPFSEWDKTQSVYLTTLLLDRLSPLSD